MSASRFAERLKALRTQAGISQTELANRAGLNRSAIAKLEGSEREPSWETVQALAAALGVDCTAFQVAPETTAAKPKPKTPKPKQVKEKPAAEAAPAEETADEAPAEEAAAEEASE